MDQRFSCHAVAAAVLSASVVACSWRYRHRTVAGWRPGKAEPAPRWWRLTKGQMRKYVRWLGTAAAVLQLGSIYAAARALRTTPRKQRLVAMDLRWVVAICGICVCVRIYIYTDTCPRSAAAFGCIDGLSEHDLSARQLPTCTLEVPAIFSTKPETLCSKLTRDGLRCSGMRLADTIFLTLPVALLQTWIGMRCSHPGYRSDRIHAV